MDKNTRGARISKTTGSFPHRLPQISLVVGAFPVFVPLTLVSSFPSFWKPSPCPQRTQALLNGIALLPETHWLGLPDVGRAPRG